MVKVTGMPPSIHTLDNQSNTTVCRHTRMSMLCTKAAHPLLYLLAEYCETHQQPSPQSLISPSHTQQNACDTSGSNACHMLWATAGYRHKAYRGPNAHTVGLFGPTPPPSPHLACLPSWNRLKSARHATKQCGSNALSYKGSTGGVALYW